MAEPRRRAVLRALDEVKSLSDAERRRIADLNIAPYDSLVLAYLCEASHLLSRGAALDWQAQHRVWQEWRDGITDAVEGALLYHDNVPLVLTIAVTAMLLPSLHSGSRLIGYKMLEEVVTLAQRTGFNPKRERHQHRLRIKEMVMRESLWVAPIDAQPPRVQANRSLNEAERADLEEAGWRQVVGVRLEYVDPHPVVRLVQVLLPIAWLSAGKITLIAPQVTT